VAIIDLFDCPEEITMFDPVLHPAHGVLPVGGHEMSGAHHAVAHELSAAEAFWFDGFGVAHDAGVVLFGHESSGKPHPVKG
jgi:hypothetical protein